MDDDEPPQGNWLISQIKNNKVAAIVSETMLCRIGMHQGTWTTEGCQRRRFCIYCGKPQYRERHRWSGPYYPQETTPFIWYVQCRNCGKKMGKTGEVQMTHTRGRQEMSLDQSIMFSDAVYLFGNTFASAPAWLDSEELPNGTKVSQQNLANQVVLAAFAYLYKKQLIDIFLGERKFLFISNMTVKVQKRQSTAPDLSGVEAIIFSSLREESDMHHLTRRLIGGWFTSSNPWDEVLDIVKENLVLRGIVKRDVRPGLFITKYKYVVIGDLSQAEKQVAELQKTLEKIQAQGEFFEHMLSAICAGIASKHATD